MKRWNHNLKSRNRMRVGSFLQVFFAAFACTNELPAALFGLLTFLVLFYYQPKRTWAFFVPAALIPLGAYFYANYLCTGGWKPFYAYYGTERITIT